jgi:MFS family permease
MVAAAFAGMFTAFGIAYSFGAFLEPMADEFGASRGTTSVFFSLTSLTYFGLGALSGVAVDRYGPRRVLLVGGLALGSGLAATSQAGELWIGLVTYGLGVGIGVACAYVPMVAVVGGWFERRRTLAIGVAVTGIGLGTLVVAPLAAALIGEVGWRTTHLVLGLTGAGVLLVCALVVARPPVQSGPAALTLGEAVRDRDYRRLYVAMGLIAVALFVPFVHLPGYAERLGLGEVPAAALVGVIGAASIAGRLVLGAVAARTGVVRAFRGLLPGDGRQFRAVARRRELLGAGRVRRRPGARLRRVRGDRAGRRRRAVRHAAARRAAGRALHERRHRLGLRRTAGRCGDRRLGFLRPRRRRLPGAGPGRLRHRPRSRPPVSDEIQQLVRSPLRERGRRGRRDDLGGPP